MGMPTSDRVRVSVADDDARWRGVITTDLESLGYAVCAQAADADEAVRATCQAGAELCVLDLNMPGGGLAAAATIKVRVPGCRVVIVTSSIEATDVERAVAAGVDGYVAKTAPYETFADALRRVFLGEQVVALGRRVC